MRAILVSLVLCLLATAPGKTADTPTAPRATADAWPSHRALAETSPFRGLPWRNVGPIVMGGRIVDVEPVPGEPYTFYVAYASGGLWKTENNGATFTPVFDGQPTLIMGDVAVDPRDPKTVWVGTGENNSSRSSYGGAGLFRSRDGGTTWTAVGLDGTDRIGRILIDPRNSDRVLVAALGRLYTEGGPRGVFLTEDGGATWTHTLVGEGWTGAIDLAFAPGDPDVVYAATWERKRRPWTFVEGGEGSGIHVSLDGGKTWTRGEGFPAGDDIGRIGLAVTPARPEALYAVVDHQAPLPDDLRDPGDGAVTPRRLETMTKEDFLRQDPEEIEDFLRATDLDPTLDAAALLRMVREDEVTLQDLTDALGDANASLFDAEIRGAEVWVSPDRGATWARVHDRPIREMVYTYGYYFGQIRVAPDDPDRLYILGVPILTSADGGATWSNINAPQVHVDHHALWIDPAHPQRLVLGNDGGFSTSFDGGATWIVLNPVPVGQFYAIAVDDAEPYNVYGGLQDNGVYRGSSKSIPGVTPPWTRIGGGDGMYVEIDPRDGTTYWGFQFGYYFRVGPDGDTRPARPRNALKEPALRYNWQTPIQLSSHNPDIVYFGANRLFRSMDRGETWTAISPDLTVSPERDNVPFATLTTIDESERVFGRIWAGTDDGKAWVTRDGGVTWSDVGTSLPAERWVSRVEASSHVDDRAYVALNGYRDDDPRTYLYATDDLGKTWRDLSSNLPAEPVNVVREDPVNPDVLYVGTDGGAYVSLDRGKSWNALAGGLPRVPVHDLVVHPRERELVAGTHGRSIWIMDVLTDDIRSSDVHVFPLEPVTFDRGWRGRRHPWWHRTETDPTVSVPFWAKASGTATWSVLDDHERTLRTATVEIVDGINQLSWDLLLDPDLATTAELERIAEPDGDTESAEGPPSLASTPWTEAVRLERPVYVTPGTYIVRIEAGGGTSDVPFTVEEPEPREPRTPPAPKIRGQRADDDDA